MLGHTLHGQLYLRWRSIHRPKQPHGSIEVCVADVILFISIEILTMMGGIDSLMAIR